MSSVEYNSAFSKPGALESLDKDYDGFQDTANEGSKSRTMTIDYSSLRKNQKLSNDVSLLTDFMGKQDRDTSAGKLEYSKRLKACIPEYNVKCFYRKDVSPFFSPRGRNSMVNNTDPL